MLTITKIQDEATNFRKLIENCDKKNTSLILDCFPIMSCKLSSMLLSYHFLNLWPELLIKGVSAATGKDDHISHFWLEKDDIVIDITGDQYNIINDKELNNKIVNSRPFLLFMSHARKKVIFTRYSRTVRKSIWFQDSRRLKRVLLRK